MRHLRHTVFAFAIVGSLACNPAEAVQRAFVASFGNDANTATNCGFANPCRGFTAAQTVTDPGGEIVALDAAGYGPITITKSITITANPGFYAGIAASSGTAVTIATAAVKVTLRGLNINGIGASDGVVMTNGNRLSIENCIISNFSTDGVRVGAAATVRIVDSIIKDNGNNGVYLSNGATATISGVKVLGSGYMGIYVSGTVASTTTTADISNSLASGTVYVGIYAYAPTAGAIARASVTRSTSSNNGYGIGADLGSGTQIITAGDNLVTGNSVAGLYQNGTATFESLGNNIVRQNGANTQGAITGVSGL